MARPAGNKPDSGSPPQGDANVTPSSGEMERVAGNETPGQDNGNTTGKKKIRNPGKAGKKLFVGARLIEFDAEGAVELDGPEAAILLGLHCGYEEA